MKIKPLHIILSVTLLIAAPSLFAAGTLKQSLDSAYIMMGRTTTLNIEMLADGPLKGHLTLQPKAYPPEVEIADEGMTDTTSIGNNRYELRRRITLQSFDSGTYTLPPVLWIDGKDTIKSSVLALKVIPVPVDTLTDIHDYADVAEPDSRWTDSMPDWIVNWGWWVLLALIIISGGVWAWWKYGRKRPQTIVAPEKQIPPYELAVMRLNELRQEHLCENGREREFYTRLTEILRQYLHSRFGINAMEMTTHQIMSAIRRNEQTRMQESLMDRVLEMADFVKFAKARPLPDDNVRTFNSAMQFVEDTKPAPEPEPSESPDINKPVKDTRKP